MKYGTIRCAVADDNANLARIELFLLMSAYIPAIMDVADGVKKVTDELLQLREPQVLDLTMHPKR